MAETEEKDVSPASSSRHEVSKTEAGYGEDPDLVPRNKLNAMFDNPLGKLSREKLLADVEDFVNRYELSEHIEVFRKGALIAQNPHHLDDIEDLTEEDRESIRREKTHKWSQPLSLYYLVTMCSLCAAVQGMDETANNGAQKFFLQRFNIVTYEEGGRFSKEMVDNLTGLVVGAPYLACAILGCWLTAPLNSLLGRRGTIWISCFIAAIASIWEAVANSWVNLFISRFVLGLGIGSKSTTVPVYAAECSPAPIRGALVMMWQMWTAFGIMLGNIMGVAFLNLGHDLNWRFMLGSTVVLPLIVCFQVYFCPESPRWLIKKNKINKAYDAFLRLRPTRIQAARDLYYCYVLVNLERKASAGRNMVWELFTISRNRRAAWASWIVMFMQQFCGVNIIAYYSTSIFLQANYSESAALLASMGTGILNWVFALPAFLTIDTFGRRNLLLFTFPWLALTMYWTGFSFFLPQGNKRVGMVTTGMYLFEVFYSPGMGPVPFVYAAEAFPLHIREIGMSFATATTWCFNFIISFTWPSLQTAFKPQGGFAWYGTWNLIGWLGVLLFLPETKELTLEELDQVFSVPTWKHSSYQLKKAGWWTRTVLLRRKEEPMQPFWEGYTDLGKES